MSNDSMAGSAMTVLGPVDVSELGITITHEHLLIEFGVVLTPPTDPAEAHMAEEKVSLENLGWVSFNWTGNRDNLRLADEEVAIDEARHYASAGGGTMVDVTSIGIGRSPEALVRISRATGLHVIMGAGYYVGPAHPPEFASKSVDEVTAEIVRDVTEGVDGTGVRSGIIGEIGCSWPWTEDEKKSVAAATAAQRQTGAALLIHPGRDERAPLEILDLIDREGGDLGRTIMGHIERTVFTPSILREVAATGAYIEYDLFGHNSPYYPLAPKTYIPGDHQRIEQIEGLVADGYLERIVLAHDVCTKHRLKRYGGHGWDHIVTRIVPWMKLRGMQDEQVDTMMVENPRRVLAFQQV